MTKGKNKAFNTAIPESTLNITERLSRTLNGFLKDIKNNRLLYALLIAVSFLPYLGTLNYPLLFDSDRLILQDERVHSLSISAIEKIFTQDYAGSDYVGMYRPLTTLTFAFNHEFLGNKLNPMGYRLFSILLHIFNALCIFLLLRALLRNPSIAFFGGLLFSLHPLGTDAVTNVIGRSDILVLFFSLLAIHFSLRIGINSKITITHIAIFLSLSSAAILSKESGAIILPLLILVDLLKFFNQQDPKGRFLNLFRSRIPLYLSAAIPLATIWVWKIWLFRNIPFKESSMVDNVVIGGDILSWQLTAWQVLGRYLYLFIFPIHLSSDYSFNQIPLITFPLQTIYDWTAILSILVISTITVFSILRLRKNPMYFFFWCFFLISIFPASNIIWRKAAIMGLRFMYVPMFGLIGIICTMISEFFIKPSPQGIANFKNAAKPFYFAFLIVLIALAFRTYHRNNDWKDGISLIRNDISTCPHSYRLNYWLSNMMYDCGITKDSMAVYIDSAIIYAENSCEIVDLLPEQHWNSEPHLRAGEYLLIKSNIIDNGHDSSLTSKQVTFIHKAEEHFEKIVSYYSKQENMNDGENSGRYAKRISLHFYTSLKYLARIAVSNSDYKYARQNIDKALSLIPDEYDLYFTLMETDLKAGNIQSALIAGVQSILLSRGNSREKIWPDVYNAFHKQEGYNSLIAVSNDNYQFDTRKAEMQELISMAFAGIFRNCYKSGDTYKAEQYKQIGINQFNCNSIYFK